MERPPRELLFDIETSNLFGDMGALLTFGYQWRGEMKKPIAISIHDYPLFKKEPWNDKRLVMDAYKILSQADSLIFHYGDDFDLPFFKTRLIEHGKYFPKKHTVDTCKAAWRHLKLSARLENLAEFFEITPKVKVKKRTWKQAGFGGKKALEELRVRCIGDVQTLGEAVEVMTPYLKLINRNLFFKEKGCPNCGSKRIRVDEKKYYASDAKIRQTYECQECKTRIKGEAINSAGVFRHE